MRDNETDRELTTLEAELKRLEAEYNMYFAGRLPRPPWETLSRVKAMVKRLDGARIVNTGTRFRFTTLQSRFATFSDLWERGLRAREEGRPGPFAPPPRAMAVDRAPKKAEDQILHVTTFSDPAHEADKLRDLYNRLADARRQVGEDPVPFDRFADLITAQVAGLKEKGSPEVAFRVALKDGKVNLTARALRGVQED